jgi:hypothetical protein
MQLGRCLESVGILPTDTRDERGAQRFLPYRFDHHFFGTTPGIELADEWFMDPVVKVCPV